MPKFSATGIAEKRMAAQLRKVAKIVGAIVDKHVDGATITDKKRLVAALTAYSDALEPWAESLTQKLIKSVDLSNKKAWSQLSTAIAKELRSKVAESSIGMVARQRQREQVELIKSLPLEAGLRAQRLSQEAAMGGRRAAEVARDISRTEEVTASRATLIARTEIAKANAALTQARADYVGATHYIWRTMDDGNVRDAHADLDGNVYRFDSPPYIEGEGAHGPGEFPNCRCYAEPILP